MPVHDLTPFVEAVKLSNRIPKADVCRLLTRMLLMYNNPQGGGGHDIIAFGCQETDYDQTVPEGWTQVAKDGAFMSGRKESAWYHWFGVIQTHLGDDYAPVESAVLLQMRLIVFAKTSIKSEIDDIDTATEGTGLGGVVGNKGGLVVRFTCRDTTFAFISCHLAAHEGKEFREKRNSDCAEVLEGARVGIPEFDVCTQTHHVFWMGDLNYRIDPYRFGMNEKMGFKGYPEGTLPKSGTPDHKEVWDKIQELIAHQDWEELYRHDELREELVCKRVLCGFEEGLPTFPPTFKVLKQKHLEKAWAENNEEPAENPLKWTEQRWPSYTDRILWHSHPTRLGDVTQLELTNVPDAITSDHKPVRSSFSAMLRPKPAPLPTTQPEGAPDIWIVDFEANDGIRAMDMTGSSDPYCFFWCPEIGIHFDSNDTKKQFKTTVKNQTLTPKWDNEEVPTLTCMTADRDLLQNAHLMISMQDYDAATADDDMGCAAVHLGPFLDKPGKFRANISLNGNQAGWVQGSIEIKWPGEDGGREKRAMKSDGCQCVLQ